MLIGHGGLKKGFVLAVAQCRSLKEGNDLIQDAEITGDLDVVGDNIRQPDSIIGDSRANPSSRFRQPPMLYIALYELPRGGSKQMLARHIRFRHDESHHVLKLVTKAIRAACLIEGRARPHSTGEGLVEKPTVQQNVHGTLRCRHLNRAKHAVPETDDRAEDGLKIGASVFSEQ